MSKFCVFQKIWREKKEGKGKREKHKRKRKLCLLSVTDCGLSEPAMIFKQFVSVLHKTVSLSPNGYRFQNSDTKGKWSL